MVNSNCTINLIDEYLFLVIQFFVSYPKIAVVVKIAAKTQKKIKYKKKAKVVGT